MRIKMNPRNVFRTLAALAVTILGFSSPAHAAVNVFFSAGSTCTGAPNASFTPGGAAVQVTLCMTTTAPTATCGHTVLLQAASAAESGRFTVVDPVILGANYVDANSIPTPVPLAINNPPTIADFGGTSSGAIAAAANQVLTTFNLSPSTSATNSSYVISLAPVSIVAVDADGTCGQTTVPTEEPISASFTLNKTLAPVFLSAASTTFAVNTSNTFTVLTSGTPTPTLGISGSLPAGVTFSAATGQISGTPTATGTFPVTLSAMNANGTAMQSFTLTVGGLASQTITFNNPPGNQPFGTSLIPLSATASSGLPVTFSSGTPAVCAISGLTNVAMLTTGTCTVIANQAGNSTFSSASQTTSFAIQGTVPGAPTISTGTAGNGLATIAFSAPASNGGAAITSYTATCSGISASSATSPITVSGLSNGVTYPCSVTATNANGTGPASTSVMVTPSSMTSFALTSVQSRKTHTGVGDFDVNLRINGPMGSVDVESRAIGTGHNIVFQFNGPVTVAGTAVALDQGTAGNPAIGTVAPPAIVNGNEVSVVLTGIPDNKRVTVNLSGVNGTLNASVTVGFLVGDVNNSGNVTSSDISGVKARSLQAANASNYRFDVNASGSGTSSDISAVKARSLATLPPPL
jgi:hypothetical protein